MSLVCWIQQAETKNDPIHGDLRKYLMKDYEKKIIPTEKVRMTRQFIMILCYVIMLYGTMAQTTHTIP